MNPVQEPHLHQPCRPLALSAVLVLLGLATAALGPAGKLVLVQRLTRGDDRLYVYEVPFGSKTYVYAVGLTPEIG